MTPESAASLIGLLTLLKDLGAYGVLGAGIWLLLTGRVVTRGHLNDVVTSERQRTADAHAGQAAAEVREAEWRRLAMRGTDEIAAPLATVVREQLGAQREAR